MHLTKNAEDELKRLYELNNLYQSKIKKRKRKGKKGELPILLPFEANTSDKSNALAVTQYVTGKLDLDKQDPSYDYFSKIFDKFKIDDPDFVEEIDDSSNDIVKKIKPMLPMLPDDEDDQEPEKISKRKQKMMRRISVATLKLRVQRPEVVEMHDANSKEPVLLIHLKSYRNTVPVPKHWSYKRKYLQGKRGFVKPPFELPDYIKATGIMEMRSAIQEREDSKNMRAKMRNKIRPKLGRGEIDYQKLHDAFFKYQCKPRMTMHGDLYYEGKEFEVKLKQKKPGDISDDLRIALGMPVGVNKHLVPPPWLIAMQRYGPPPSYPNLKIAGLNAPIPEGATFGYHAGGWGKPPIDELGRPLYGDVFGTNLPPDNIYAEDDEIDKSLWGEMEAEPPSEAQSDEEMEDVSAAPGIQPPSSSLVLYNDGMETPSMSALTLIDKTGIEPLDYLELRKRKTEAKPESHLYSVIPTKQAEQPKSIVQTSHVYDIKSKQDVNVVDDIEEIDMDMDVDTSPPPEIFKKESEKPPISKPKKTSEDKSSKKGKDFKF